jgi:hypothetical protein
LFLVAGCASGGKPGVAPDTNGDQADAPVRPDAPEMIDAPVHPDAMPDAMQQPVTVTLQETTNNTLVIPNSGACQYTDGLGNTVATADNVWYRAFQLSDFNITNTFHVTQVTFGVEAASGSPNAQVKVGSYTGAVGGATIDLTMITPLNAAPVNVTNTTTGEMVPVPITADIPAGGKLVVQIAAPDYGSTSNRLLFIGSSNAGETKPGYWTSTGCAVTAPETTAAAGFPTENMIILVTGNHLM